MNKNPNGYGFSNLCAASASFSDSRRSRAFSSLYSLMRIVDELADQLIENPDMPSEKGNKIEEEIKRWHTQIEYCYMKNKDTSRIDLSLLKAIAMFQIPYRLWDDFFHALTLPVKNKGFETLDELYAYSLGAAAVPMTVFLIMCFAEAAQNGTFVVPEREKVFAAGESLGIWSFMIHVLSIAKTYLTDKSPVRNLFPIELMSRHGISLEDLTEMARTGSSDDRCRNMIREFMDIASEQGRLGLGFTRDRCLKLSRDCCTALAIPLSLYSEFTRRIERNGHGIFEDLHGFEPGDQLAVISRVESCQSAEELKALW